MIFDAMGPTGFLFAPSEFGCADFDCNPRDGIDDRDVVIGNGIPCSDD
ncbi:MAG: hypothetical protein IPH76_17350 [Xanthomonadales bacterium]|nr:hypothetical protein [Xanthomonadales bacterium]